MQGEVTLRISSKIRVLLVDDEPLAIEGWKKVLGNSSQIDVIGEATPTELPLIADIKAPPEIVIAGYSLMQAGLLKESLIRSMWGVHPKIILIVSNSCQLETALRAKIDKVVMQNFEDQDLINWVRGLSDHAKSLCAEYRQQLKLILSDEKTEDSYCNLVRNIIEFLFHPDLVNPREVLYQTKTRLSSRLVFRNQSKDHPFWMESREKHAAKYVSVDIYNQDIGAERIHYLEEYLSSAHGKLGLLIGHNSPFALKAIPISIFDNSQKLILMITSAHLQDMLAYKAGGINPVCVLQDLYQDLIASALSKY